MANKQTQRMLKDIDTSSPNLEIKNPRQATQIRCIKRHWKEMGLTKDKAVRSWIKDGYAERFDEIYDPKKDYTSSKEVDKLYRQIVPKQNAT